jgi:zinc transport system ATP-binding protein
MAHTLEVYFKESLVFSSDGRWLYPLFELEHFLASGEYDPATLTVRDKIVGKAAALMLVRLGIRDVHAGIMSKLGVEALERHNVSHGYDTFVDRIECRTEEMLIDEFDPEKAYQMLRRRAKL